ncbi:MAG TPA: glycoside hydrolase family 27 protein, partial [Chitinophagaceae bacterium]|nr:glycoside hydrolase family 27 protein [Chitinophagaceae bacterium]
MKLRLTIFTICILTLNIAEVNAQSLSDKALTPPMGWMTWNLFGEHINEGLIKEMADAMVSSGMLQAGYRYLIIDDGWQGGRDNRNNIIPDPIKFPSGIKALADYLHDRNIKIGIYSDAAPLTCAGYTASLNFEEQDAKTFASWGIDYLKYDYCNAPEDSITAKARYKKMADALVKSGRQIVFGICEWGGRKPWHWAANAGGNLWRTTGDVRDKWKAKPNTDGMGILDIADINAELYEHAGPGRWNDADMLVVGLYGAKGPASDLGGTGCSDIEYQSQVSLWSIMAAPLIATNNLRDMNAETKRILMNEEVIAVNQDKMGRQAIRKINNETWDVFVKQLDNNDVAIAILNKSGTVQNCKIDFKDLGLTDNYNIKDLWIHKIVGKGKNWKVNILAH